MVHRCVVRGCGNVWYPESDIIYHVFPKDIARRKLWLSIVPLKTKFYESARICSFHFNESDYEFNRTHLKKTAVPFFKDVPSLVEEAEQLKADKSLSSISDLMPIDISSDFVTPTSASGLLKLTERQPRKELAVPTTCISKGNERYLEYPVLTSVLLQSKNNMQAPWPLQEVTSTQETTSVFIEESPIDVADITDTDSEDTVVVKSEIEIEEEEEIQKCSNTGFQMPRPFLSTKKEANSLFLEVSPMEIADKAENKLPPPIPKPELTYKRNMLIDPRQKISFLQRKVKILDQKLRRKNIKHENLKKLIKAVRIYTKSSEIENILSGNFRKLCAAYNNNGVCVNYSDEVIKFAITVHYYSPKAYEFIRKFMSLPTERMLKKYASTGTYIINIDE